MFSSRGSLVVLTVCLASGVSGAPTTSTNSSTTATFTNTSGPNMGSSTTLRGWMKLEFPSHLLAVQFTAYTKVPPAVTEVIAASIQGVTTDMVKIVRQYIDYGRRLQTSSFPDLPQTVHVEFVLVLPPTVDAKYISDEAQLVSLGDLTQKLAAHMDTKRYQAVAKRWNVEHLAGGAAAEESQETSVPLSIGAAGAIALALSIGGAIAFRRGKLGRRSDSKVHALQTGISKQLDLEAGATSPSSATKSPKGQKKPKVAWANGIAGQTVSSLGSQIPVGKNMTAKVHPMPSPQNAPAASQHAGYLPSLLTAPKTVQPARHIAAPASPFHVSVQRQIAGTDVQQQGQISACALDSAARKPCQSGIG